MKATFVVHENTPVPGKEGAASVVLRPVVNEEATNRDWSSGTTPTGELRLQVTNPDVASKLVVGQRLEIALDFAVAFSAAGKK